MQNYLLQTTMPMNSDNVNMHILHTINSKFSLNGGYNLNSRGRTRLEVSCEYGGNAVDAKSGRHTGTFPQLDATRGREHATELEPQPHADAERQFVREQHRRRTGDHGSFHGSDAFGIPAIKFSSFSGLNDPVPSLVRNQTLRLRDSVKWVHRKAHFHIRRRDPAHQLNADSDPKPRGRFNFTGVMTSQLDCDGPTGHCQRREREPYYELADFLLGLPYSTTVQFGPSVYLRSWDFIAYAQDDWRVNKRFTFFSALR